LADWFWLYFFLYIIVQIQLIHKNIYALILLTETGIELIDGILVLLFDNNEEEVLCEVGRLKLGERLADELISSV